MKKLLKRIACVVGGAFFALGAKLLTFGYDWQDVVSRYEKDREHDTIPDERAKRPKHAWN